jgi:Arc/MetJ-type ribon-helix-helix transcriptional regulator
MAGVKVSMSVPDDDVEFLDDYAKTHGIASRSAAVQRAIRLLRASELTDAYAAAFVEWADDANNDVWDAATADS